MAHNCLLAVGISRGSAHLLHIRSKSASLNNANFPGPLPNHHRPERCRIYQQLLRLHHGVAIAVALQDFGGKGLTVSLEVKSVVTGCHLWSHIRLTCGAFPTSSVLYFIMPRLIRRDGNTTDEVLLLPDLDHKEPASQDQLLRAQERCCIVCGFDVFRSPEAGAYQEVAAASGRPCGFPPISSRCRSRT